MSEPWLPADEAARLEKLNQSGALTQISESALADLVLLVQQICRTSMATISFIDTERQWIKASLGFPLQVVTRVDSICSHVLLQSQPLIIADLRRDSRFEQNPLVLSAPNLVAYASVPIQYGGFTIGTVAAMDCAPMEISPDQVAALEAIARQVSALIELKQTATELDRVITVLNKNARSLELVLGNAPIILFAVDPQGKILLAEGRSLQALRLQSEQVIGQSVFDIYRDELQVHEYLRKALQGSSATVVLTVQNQTFEIRHRLTLDADGKLTGLIGVALEITEHVRVEQALRESEERYKHLAATAQRQAQDQTLLNRVRTAIAREIDLASIIRSVVESIAETFGYTLVSLYMRRDDRFYCQYQVGYANVIQVISINAGVIGRVYRSGRPILLKDVTVDLDFLGAMEGIVSEIAVPLTDSGEVVGVLNVESVQGIQLNESDLELLVALADHVVLAISRARLFAEARRQAQELALLDQVRSAIARQLDLPDLFRTVVEAIASTFGYTQISFYSRAGNRLLLQHQIGYSTPFETIELDQGLIGYVASTGKPALIADVNREPRYREARSGVVSEIAVPVFDNQLVAGVLNIESTNNIQLTEADLSLMTALSDQIGIAIVRTRLYAEAQRRNRLLTALHETALDLLNRLELGDLLSAIVSRAGELVNTEHGFICLGEPGADEVEIKVAIGHEAKYVGGRLHSGEGLAGKVWQTGEPSVVENYSTWLGRSAQYPEGETWAAAAVPLRSGSQLIGVLATTYRDSGRVFGEEEVEILSRFAQLATIAIDNARLYTSAQAELQDRKRIEVTAKRQNQYLAALYDMTLGMMNRLEVAGLLEIMILRAGQLVDTEHGFIYLTDETGAELELKWGVGVHARDIGAHLKRGEGLAGRVWLLGQTLVIQDYANWAYRSHLFDDSPVRAVAGIPLRSTEQVVGVLGVSFNEPGRIFTTEEAESLERFAQLASVALDNARLYTTAQRELDERNRTEQALAAANVELEQALMNAKELAIASQSANRAKSEFLANMSHELRTPLSAVMGYTELLQATPLADEQKEYLEQVRVSSEALLGIISDVLDFSKIEAGHFELERAEFNLLEIARQALYTMMPNAAAKKLPLTIEAAPEVPRFVVGDAARLRQILLNLISNAVKFTQQGQVVLRIAARRVMSERYILHFAVEDTGVGIPADMLTMIFEPFTQVDGSMTRRHGGTGLGLAIARQLVEMFDGEIWVDSELEHGSTFNFTATFGRASGSGEGTIDHSNATAAYSGLPEPSTQHLHILLAEDNVVNQRVIARMLEKLGWEVMVVNDGRAAVAESGEYDYDLILMDIQMPDMDGLNATVEIRSRERQIGGHIPIIALTAYAMQGDRERCLIAGMDDYLSKPVRVEDLQQVIERYTHLNSGE